MVAAGGATNTPAASETPEVLESPMNTSSHAPPRIKPTRSRKPLEAVSVVGRFVGGATP
jgi:hypothetical protein